MPRILNVKDEAVTQGVLDKNVSVVADQVEVTFEDDSGTPHTIFYHKEGPFKSPEDAVTAWQNRELHPNADDVELPHTDEQQAGGVFT